MNLKQSLDLLHEVKSIQAKRRANYQKNGSDPEYPDLEARHAARLLEIQSALSECRHDCVMENA
jgi:hypothetical protein